MVDDQWFSISSMFPETAIFPRENQRFREHGESRKSPIIHQVILDCNFQCRITWWMIGDFPFPPCSQKRLFRLGKINVFENRKSLIMLHAILDWNFQSRIACQMISDRHALPKSIKKPCVSVPFLQNVSKNRAFWYFLGWKARGT